MMGVCVGAHKLVVNLINCLYLVEVAQVVAAPIQPISQPQVQVQQVPAQPVMAPAPIVAGVLGKLKLHLKACNL